MYGIRDTWAFIAVGFTQYICAASNVVPCKCWERMAMNDVAHFLLTSLFHVGTFHAKLSSCVCVCVSVCGCVSISNGKTTALIIGSALPQLHRTNPCGIANKNMSQLPSYSCKTTEFYTLHFNIVISC
jgi:hypothetical protein